MFLLPSAVALRGAEIGAGWAGSLTMGAGQFCTNPGIAVGISGSLDAFTQSAIDALSGQDSQVMLTDGIAAAYQRGVNRMIQSAGVQTLVDGGCTGREASPVLAKTSGDQWLKQAQLGDEVFGPFGLIVEVDSLQQMRSVANAIDGQLTCTIHRGDGDQEFMSDLVPILERKAGRILVDSFPTGVEVSDAMVHGGPYPASTNFGATSVGSLSIRRFLRPVCYQNLADEFIPGWS